MTIAMRFALKIAYDGTKFSGSQRQPKVRTVDGECIFVLKKTKAISGPKESRFQSASRTDVGVSAIGNVIAFDTDKEGEALIGSFNSAARDVWAWAMASVPESFNARRAVQRWYRYHLPGDLDVERAAAAAQVFQGRHDFRRFTRARTNTVRTLDSLQVSRANHFLCLDVRGQSFLWSMIRRIVAAVELYCMGEITLGEIERVLAGEEGDLGMAPPEPLVLMDVVYPFDFDEVRSRKVKSEITDIIQTSRMQLARWSALATRLGIE